MGAKYLLIKCEWLHMTLLAGKEKEKRHFFRNTIIHFTINYFGAMKSVRVLVYSLFLGDEDRMVVGHKDHKIMCWAG